MIMLIPGLISQWGYARNVDRCQFGSWLLCFSSSSPQMSLGGNKRKPKCSGPCHPCGKLGWLSWHWPCPVWAVVAIWAVSQKMKIFLFLLLLSYSAINRSAKRKWGCWAGRQEIWDKEGLLLGQRGLISFEKNEQKQPEILLGSDAHDFPTTSELSMPVL